MELGAVIVAALLAQTPTESTKADICAAELSTTTTVAVDGTVIASQDVSTLVSDRVALCALPDPDPGRPAWCDDVVNVESTDGVNIQVTKAEIVGPDVCPN